MLGQCQDGRHRDSQVVAADVVDFGALDVLPDLGLLQVVDIVEVGGSKVGAERAVVAGDYDTAASGRSLLVVAVQRLDAGLLVDLLKSLTILVLTDAANVDGGVLGEDVLRAAGGVLCSSTGNEHGIVVLDQVLIETEVLLFGEDGIVGLEAVLLKKLLITA